MLMHCHQLCAVIYLTCLLQKSLVFEPTFADNCFCKHDPIILMQAFLTAVYSGCLCLISLLWKIEIINMLDGYNTNRHNEGKNWINKLNAFVHLKEEEPNLTFDLRMWLPVKSTIQMYFTWNHELSQLFYRDTQVDRFFKLNLCCL